MLELAPAIIILSFNWRLFGLKREAVGLNKDLYNNRFVLAMDYLQSEYLRQVYTNTEFLIQDALDRLLKDEANNWKEEELVVKSIGILIERLPVDAERTGEIMQKYEAVRRRVNGRRFC